MKHTVIDLSHKNFTTTDGNLLQILDWLQYNVGIIQYYKIQYSINDIGTSKTENLPWFWTAHFDPNIQDLCTKIKFYILDKNNAIRFRLIWG